MLEAELVELRHDERHGLVVGTAAARDLQQLRHHQRRVARLQAVAQQHTRVSNAPGYPQGR